METMESLKRSLHTAEDLHSLVRTMKALAAVNIRQLEHAVESLVDYRRTIDLGLRVVLGRQEGRQVTSRTAPKRNLGLVVIGSDQGMCGQLNDRIVSSALAFINGSGDLMSDVVTLAVGSRAASRLDQAEFASSATLAVASSPNGITPLVHDILLHIDRWHTERRIDRIVVFYCEHAARGAYSPLRLDLLPIDRSWLDQLRSEPWPSPVLPTFTMDMDVLFSALIRQYLFVCLYGACAESQVSENASRLAAMRGAERNIGERISELKRQFHQTRQMAITEELLDIASGFQAIDSDSQK